MITTIDVDDLRPLDLNLLPVFLVLLQERSTTKAASNLGIGQPAVSAALARLRVVFGDQLFTRIPRGLEPTPRALALAAQLSPALSAIRQALRPPEAFDPAKADLIVRLGMPDNHEHVVLPELLARLQSEAPSVRVVVRTASSGTAAQMLDEGQVDLVCGQIDKVTAWQHRQELTTFTYACLYDKRRLPLLGSLTLTRFLSLDHLLVSPRGDLLGVVDDALAKLGKSRRVIYATPHFSSIPVVLQRVAAIATLPSHAAHRFAKVYRLELAEPPFPLQSHKTALAWLAKYDEDPMHRWLRALVIDTVKRIFAPPTR